jgi:Protein of unknown function (DUF3180)
MKPTSIPWLLGVAGIAALLGWGFAAWVDGNGRLPAVPWLAVVVIWVVAAFVGAWTVVARRRLHPKPGAPRMAPLMAARTTALALAGSRTGAVAFGTYGGVALRLLQETAVAAGRERLLASALAALGGLVLAALSLWLEHNCRLPDDTDESPARATGSEPGPAGAPS